MKKDEGYFSSKDNTRLYWQSIAPEAPKAWVAVVHGYGDHSGRYRVPMESLAKAGFASMALDYRGHGKADGKRGDALHWSDYLDDLDVFWARVRRGSGLVADLRAFTLQRVVDCLPLGRSKAGGAPRSAAGVAIL